MKKQDKINYKSAEDTLSYYDIQPHFIVVDENENFELYEYAERHPELEDLYPDQVLYIDDLERQGLPYEGSSYECKDVDYDGSVWYSFCPWDDEILVYLGENGKFTTKEALTIINLVQGQVKSRTLLSRVAYGMQREDEDDCDYTRWSQDITTFGCWWEKFLDFFNEHKEETKHIHITIDDSDGTIWITMCDFEF